jgi:hypothetical protein
MRNIDPFELQHFQEQVSLSLKDEEQRMLAERQNEVLS